jgi:L-lactate dehydrogenase complex protein LldF
MVSGPRRPQDEDGPEEFHLIIVDNGRSKMLADPQLREVLYCIRCGACLNICPIYQKVGGHAYGWVYPGPIGAIVTPMLVGLKETKDLPQASSLCGACREACPLKINIPRMLLHLRHKIAESPYPGEKAGARTSGMLAGGYTRLMRSPLLLSTAHKVGRNLQTLLVKIPLSPFAEKGKGIRKMPLPLLSRWTRARDLPKLPHRTFREIWRRELSAEEGDA